VDADRIEAALAGLPPESRALVELSVIRQVADEDIASLLGTDEGSVRSRREDALAALAASLGATSSEEVGGLVREMRALPSVRWRDGDGPRAAAVEPVEEPEPESESERPEPEPQREPEPPPPVVQTGAKRKSRVVPILFGGILVAAVVALVLALSGGGGDEPEQAERPSAPAPSTAGKRAKLAPLAGGAGEATAALREGTLELSVAGLPDPGGDGYVVWLYNSLSEARPLNRPRSERAFQLDAKLPEGAERYRFIDISREPGDDNRNHSGESVLRVPISKLR